jgi:hypothetical protein
MSAPWFNARRFCALAIPPVEASTAKASHS